MYGARDISPGRGYGIAVQRSSYCLFENNIGQKQRHSIILAHSAHSNVIAYNYTLENDDGEDAEYNQDICLHGNYPYANLFEGNIAWFIEADDHHGPNGPYNTFFRNFCYNTDNMLWSEMYLGVFSTDYANLVGNFAVPDFDGNEMWRLGGTDAWYPSNSELDIHSKHVVNNNDPKLHELLITDGMYGPSTNMGAYSICNDLSYYMTEYPNHYSSTFPMVGANYLGYDSEEGYFVKYMHADNQNNDSQKRFAQNGNSAVPKMRGELVFSQIYNISVNYDYTEYGGFDSNVDSFTGYEGNPITISASPTKTANGITGLFAGWTDDFSAPNPCTIMPISNTSYTALYKFPTHTNNLTAFSKNNSQRKTVQTPDNILHMVYESMGKVWYERSSDDGANWELVGALNQGRSAKNPSIDYMWDVPSQAGDGYKKVAIIYDGETGSGTYAVCMETYFLYNDEYLTYGTSFLSDPNTESHNSNPVIALGVEQKFMAIWINEQNELICGNGSITPFGGFGGWNTGYPKETITNSGIPVGANFALVSTKDYDVNSLSSFYFAVEIKSSSTAQSSVFLSKLKSPSYIDDLSDEYFIEPKYTNSNPSISLIADQNNNKLPIVAIQTKDEATSDFLGYVKVIDWDDGKNLISSAIIGTDVLSIQTATPLRGNEAVVAWTEDNSTLVKYVSYQNFLFSSPIQMSESGTSFSLSSGGENSNKLRAYVLDTTTLPYSINQTSLPFSLPTIISSSYAVSSGNYVCNSNITVNSGVTLTIAAGTNITFQNGSALIVNGTLNVNGTSTNKVTFDFQAQNSTLKNGIKVSAGGVANISNAIIKNAYNGVYVNEAVANLSNCEIFDCTYGTHFYRTNYVTNNKSFITNNHFYDNADGLLLSYSTAQISNNEFSSNSFSGINCSNYSSPDLAPDELDSYSTGYNYIHNNYHGIYALYSSNPFLGRESCEDFGGNNSFESNSVQIKAASYCSIYAENNWWGTSSPTSSLFALISSFVDYTPYLLQSPFVEQSAIKITPEEEEFNNKFTPQVTSSANATEQMNLATSTIDKPNYDEKWSIEWKLLYARNLMRIKKYNQAADICESVITDYPDSARSYLALDLLWQARKNDNKTLFNQFVDYKSKSKVKKQIYGAAELMLAVGEKDNKIKLFEEIEAKYSKTALIEHVLFSKFMYYLYEENNIELAKTTADELGKLYPESESYYASQRHLGNDVVKPTEQLLTKESVNEATTEIPQTYELLGNYPNPFNPSTTIKYALPYSSDVELTIYDITGKVITTLNRNGQSAGYQNIVWNGNSQQGSRVSSGVYFYRFKATSLENNGKMFEKTAKMLLLK